MSAFNFSVRFENLDKLVRNVKKAKTDLKEISLNTSTCKSGNINIVIYLMFDWNKFRKHKKVSIRAQVKQLK